MEELLKQYQKILNLTNWTLEVSEESTLASDGEAKMVFNDYFAQIRILKTLSDKNKELTLIHELIHLVHRNELDIVQENIPDSAFTIYSRFHERSIEQMAKSIYALNHKIGIE